MADRVTFQDDIEALEDTLSRMREKLDELESRWEAHKLKTGETREALEHLRRSMRGELPDHLSAGPGGIDPVDVNPETGRPARGARRAQVEQICRKVGRGEESFRTVDVLNVLEDVEGGLSDGMKSYTYAVMSTLEDDGLVDKVGRGRWTLSTTQSA